MPPAWTYSPAVRVRRVLAIAAASLVGIEVVWVLAMNPFLNSALFARLINRKPDVIRIEWQRARTWWPGDLRVTGFVIRGNHINIQWVLELDRAHAQVGLAALLGKKFLARDLSIDGASLRIRRHPRTSFQLAKKDVVPPIPWAEFEIRPASEDPKAIIRAQERPPPKRLWAADLRGIDVVRVREIWIDEYRFEGDARYDGHYFIRPKERLDIRPSMLFLDAGTIRLGADEALDVRRGEVALALEDVDLTVHRLASEMLPFLRGAVRVECGVKNVRFVDFYLSRFPGVEIQSGPGALFVNLATDDDGVVSGAVDLKGSNVIADYEGTRIRGDLVIDGRLRRWKLGEGELDVSGSHGEVRDVVVADAGSTAPGNGWWGTVTLEDARLDAGERLRLASTLSVKLRDTAPLIALFEAKKDLPGPLEEAFRVRDVEGRATLRTIGGAAEIRPVKIEGKDLEVRAALSLRDDRKKDRAILYVKRGPFSIGLQRGGDRKVKITRPKEWFQDHPLSGDAVWPDQSE